MGKRAREKKLAKLAVASQEKTLIEVRKQTRALPRLRYAKQIGLALAVTVLLLWVGEFVITKISILGQKG